MKTRLASLLLWAMMSSALADAKSPEVVVGRIDTPIHPAAANYLQKLIQGAERDGASLIVLGLSTPGGLLTSTQEMTSAILSSKVPVATFVWPSGSCAASAGFFILLSGDVAAMAPGTSTGAAHPVAGEGQELPKTLNEKAEQHARGAIRAIAEQRGRDAKKAELAVSSSRSFTDTEARDAKLIDLIAHDVPELLRLLDGRVLRRSGPEGTTRDLTLHLKGYQLQVREMSQVEKLLGVVSHPNVAYILFLLGLVGLYFELSSPGAILPGIVGGISLLLALYAFSVLPVNLAGLALILFAILLFLAEVKVASHGLLAVGGAISLVAGSLLLFSGRRGQGDYRVDLGIILPSLALTLAVVGFLTWKTLELRRSPATTGAASMIGETGRVVEWPSGGAGKVHLYGEYWDAAGPADLMPGDIVRIVRVEGLKLQVERRT